MPTWASREISRLSAELIALLDVEDSHAHIKLLGVLSQFVSLSGFTDDASAYDKDEVTSEPLCQPATHQICGSSSS